MKKLLSLLTILLLTTAVYPQQLGVWKNFSNLQNIRDAYVTDDGIWAACQGGVFFYNRKDNSYLILNKAEGLSNNQLTGIALDAEGKVWIGSENGSIDIYSPSTREYKRILELANTNRLAKNINEIYASGDTIFIATEFGLSLINSKTFSFYESCTKFGTFNADLKVLSSFKTDRVYVTTLSGIASQKSVNSNFSAPESWNSFANGTDLPAASVKKILAYRDTVIAITDRGILYQNGNSWQIKDPALISYGFLDAKAKNDTLFLITDESKLIVYTKGKVTFPYPQNSYIKFAKMGSSNGIFVITSNGLVDLSKPQDNYIAAPNGPRANLFNEMAVDKDGNLYVASGGDRVNLGYYKFNGSTWLNFSTGNNPALGVNSIHQAYVAPDNVLYLGTWGNGFIRIKDQDTAIFNSNNTGMVGPPAGVKYLVIHGFKTDSKGNLWVTNYQSEARQPLSRLSTDNTWTHFTNPMDYKDILARGLVIDNNNTKWFAKSETNSPIGKDLYYFNEEKSLYSTDQDGWGKITSEDGLSGSGINCLALGRRGEIWVGMTDGISIIDDPSRPRSTLSTVYIMRAQNAMTIAVDALNQKWVGTDKGVFLLSSDGTKLIENYTVENSPLPDNRITSIAIDNKTGTVYIGTLNGLAAVTTNSVNPQENLDNMYAYPNPVTIDKGGPVNINISGLVRDSEIKIFTVSGKMVANFVSPGAGIATWDGKDSSGELVQSGVYLIVAYDKDGSNVGTAKVAIIKK